VEVRQIFLWGRTDRDGSGGGQGRIACNSHGTQAMQFL
jgi:hypothetical protein